MVNRLENGLTLNLNLCHYFETFDVVFRPTEQPDVYDLEWMSPLRCLAGRRFTSNDETMRLTSSDSNLALPRPQFLEMHYRLGHILKDSKYLHHFDFEREMGKTFDYPASVMPDGSTDLGRIITEKLLMHI
ncbi:hypothetical protein GQ607_012226 [Colletotrichum asianum]|uniref:HNH nuclease domain-containing protein n=1 Tax=Colletotrichum asianum TaxID=702518 RepID=A0A8H3ZQY7_9PEZI|nr:hypothetical protein GQ607_012226 [Colletotrichum asianum]